MTTNILHEDEEFGTRTIELSGVYDYSVREAMARFTENKCMLIRLDENKKPRTFGLTADEMDILAKEWMAFRAFQAERLDKEIARLASVLAEAKKLAEDNPPITIEVSEEGTYPFIVKCERITSGRFAYDPDNLLKVVNGVLDDLKNHQEMIRQEQSIIDEAKALAAQYGIPVCEEDAPHLLLGKKHAMPGMPWHLPLPFLQSVQERIATMNLQPIEESTADNV